jgi:hypothetical protein
MKIYSKYVIELLELKLGPEDDGTHVPKHVDLDSNSTCWKERCVDKSIIIIATCIRDYVQDLD